jgi:hypothetical protein
MNGRELKVPGTGAFASWPGTGYRFDRWLEHPGTATRAGGVADEITKQDFYTTVDKELKRGRRQASVALPKTISWQPCSRPIRTRLRK